MASINRATILGNVGRDPEIRSLNNGDKVANLSVATTEKWTNKNSGEKQEATQWHRITVWGKMAEIIEKYVRKGSRIYIEGAIETRKWTDNAGVEKYTTEIVARPFNGKIVLLDKRPDGAGSGGGGSSGGGGAGPMDDDIPF